MPIYYGNNEIESLFYGGNQIDEAYYGGNLVYSNLKTVILGTATSFDIKSSYPTLYNKLTADNFFALSANAASGSTGIRMRPGDDREWSGFTGSLAKGYNASTGILTFYLACSPGNGSAVRAVMIPKIKLGSNLIDLGEGTSFNVSSISGYNRFTADNFVVLSSGSCSHGNMYYAQTYEYSDYGSCNVTLEKSYNSSNGVLSCYVYLRSWDTGGVYTYYNGTASANVHAYLML